MKPINDQPDRLPALRPPARWLPALLLLAATFLAYQPVWQAEFIWDDEIMLTRNPVIHAADGLRAIWCSTALPDYFPVTSTVLWLEWRLWGNHPLGYHLVNVLLHGLGAVLLWRVLARLTVPGAWLAAAVFALHPVNVESVAWVTELKNTLALFFFTLTLWAYLKDVPGSRGQGGSSDRSSVVSHQCPANTDHRLLITDHSAPLTPYYWLSLFFFLLALLSKTAVAPLPLVLLGLAWWRRGQVEWRDVRRIIPFLAVAAALAAVTIWFQYHRAIGPATVRTDGFGSRLATAGWAVWFYLYKALLPVNLSFVYPRWQVNAAGALAYVPGLLAAGGLLACWLHRHRWGRGWLIALGYFAVMLLPVLGFLDISFMRYSLVADRWQYFAIIGPIALVAAGISRGLRFQISNLKSQISMLPCIALLVTLGVLTWQRCATFTSLETLWRATLAQNPRSAMAHTDLANVLIQKGREDEAIVHYQEALALDPDDELANYNYGYVLLQRGRADEAIEHFQKALARRSDSVPARYHLASALLQQGQTDAAAAQLRRVVESAPDFAEARNSLGDVLLRQGRVDEAVLQFQQALRIQPRYPNALSNLGIALFQQGKQAEAVALFRQALEFQPGLVEARINLGKALLQQGLAPEAVAHFRQALTLHPDDPATLSDLAWVLATWPEAPVRNGAEARELAQRAKQLTGGENPVILRTLAAALAEGGQFTEAVATARRALPLADAALAEALRAEIALYEAGAPVREGLKSETRPAAPKPGEGGNSKPE